MYYKDRRLPIPYHGVAWVYGGKPVDPTCTPISIYMEDALGSHHAAGVPVMPMRPVGDVGGAHEGEEDEGWGDDEDGAGDGALENEIDDNEVDCGGDDDD